ncbi:MAG: hypothetical protein ACUVQP_08210 [Bacteroidales bacterium]
MGATNCPETPRQKMIGMMYLFLTAMLALNVSKDILNAFATVNEGLQKTNVSFSLSNGFTYDAFERAKQNDPIKVAPYYEAAAKAKKYAEEVYNFLNEKKIDLIMQCDGKTREEAEKAVEDLILFEAKDQRDIPHFYMLGESVDGSKGEARNIKNKLNEYKKNLLELFKYTKIQ